MKEERINLISILNELNEKRNDLQSLRYLSEIKEDIQKNNMKIPEKYKDNLGDNV